MSQPRPSLVLGIDEAGRGPALGPLVLAAVALGEEAASRLLALGVMDSKQFGSGDDARFQRASLVAEIEQHANFVAIEVCDVSVVDDYTAHGRLNTLERERAARLIRRAPTCTRIIADGKRLFGPLAAEFPGLEGCDKAESIHAAVAAASLCAKSRRDDLFACIQSRYEPRFGSITGGGYTTSGNQPLIDGYQAEFGALPPEARVSWPWEGNASVFRVGSAPPRQLSFF